MYVFKFQNYVNKYPTHFIIRHIHLLLLALGIHTPVLLKPVHVLYEIPSCSLWLEAGSIVREADSFRKLFKPI